MKITASWLSAETKQHSFFGSVWIHADMILETLFSFCIWKFFIPPGPEAFLWNLFVDACAYVCAW